MPTPSDLPGIIDLLLPRLAALSGARAVVLGGSHARGVARHDSDIDLAIGYRDAEPLDVAAVQTLAEEVNDTLPVSATAIGGWGPWVNGGAWLTIGGRRVDLLYRSIDRYEQVLEAAAQGQADHDWLQQPAYGFPSTTYLGEIEACRPLHDPFDEVLALKARVRPYPPALQASLAAGFLWGAGFSVENGRKPAARDDAYAALGCITRGVCMLTLALYAMNERYYMSDKGALDEVASFATCPPAAAARLDSVLRSSDLPAALAELEELVAEAQQIWSAR